MSTKKKVWNCDKCGIELEWGQTEKGFRPVLTSDHKTQHLTNYCKGQQEQQQQQTTKQQIIQQEPVKIQSSRQEAITAVENRRELLNSEAQDLISKINYIQEWCRKADNLRLTESKNSNGTIEQNYRQLNQENNMLLKELLQVIKLQAQQLQNIENDLGRIPKR